MTDDAQPALPLFYREPRLLSSVAHAGWRIAKGDYAFAATTPSVPVVVGEFAELSRFYPVVFAAGDAAPVAVLGLDTENLFVKGGTWDASAYLPAYVRRYPFGFVATTNPDGFALVIDAAAETVMQSGETGVALFQDGQPGNPTREALALCEAFRRDADLTAEFAAALVAQDLLIDRRADATLPDGRRLALDGFRIIDGEKLAKLDAETVVAWHGKGWLALAYFHLASLARFTDLLARRGSTPRADVAAPVDVTEPVPALVD